MPKWNKQYDDINDYETNRKSKKGYKNGSNHRNGTSNNFDDFEEVFSDYDRQKLKQRDRYNNKKKYKNKDSRNKDWEDYESW